MRDDRQWLTVTEAAELAGYHPERIRELARDNQIEARKFSIVWQVNRRSLMAYLDKMKRRGAKRGPKSEG